MLYALGPRCCCLVRCSFRVNDIASCKVNNALAHGFRCTGTSMLTQSLAVQVGLELEKVRSCSNLMSVPSPVQSSIKCIMCTTIRLLSAGTSLRDCARILASECLKRVIIVDTSNEIGGDGDIPHPSITTARRMQVASSCRELLHCCCAVGMMQWTCCGSQAPCWWESVDGKPRKPLLLPHRFPTLWSSTVS